jgi:hypothetical protein
VNPEIAAYEVSIRERLALLADRVRGLSADQLNWRPPVERPNSAWVLATHTVGNARAWILGIACGDERRRDRPAEFASRGDDGAALAAEIERAAAECSQALAALAPARLDVVLLPPQDLFGEGPTHEVSVRDAIIQVIEHASLHLGHLDMLIDVMEGQRG